ncbi:uncharacterized protein LOC142564985 isoform X2 [Dermacentor variabilis]
MKNVSRLMTPAGECLLQFPAVSPARALWRKMAQLEHWKKFSNVFDGFTPKSHDLEDDIARLSYMRELLDSAGLMANTCELLYGGFDYETPQANIDILLSVNPVGATLSPQETELLRSDVTNEVLKWKSDNDLSARPCMYLVHARKRNE